MEIFDKNSQENTSLHLRALQGEPMFILLGRDPAMGSTIRAWCRERSLAIIQGLRANTPEEHAHVREGMRLAEIADEYFLGFIKDTPQKVYERRRKQQTSMQLLTHADIEKFDILARKMQAEPLSNEKVDATSKRNPNLPERSIDGLPDGAIYAHVSKIDQIRNT